MLLFWRCETCSTKVSLFVVSIWFLRHLSTLLGGLCHLSTFLEFLSWWGVMTFVKRLNSQDLILPQQNASSYATISVCVHMNWVSIDSRQLLYLMHAPCDPVSCYYHPYYNSSSKRGKFVVNWCCMCKKDEEIGGSLTASLWFYLGSLAHGFLTICMSWQMLRSVIPLNGVWKGTKVSKRGVDGSFTCIFCDEW